MGDLIKKALAAPRESKHIEFKRSFDPTSRPQWCEVIKDIVAIANSGGGILVFGLDDNGKPTGFDVSPIVALDPAEIADKITSFTGAVDLEFEIQSLSKDSHALVAFVIHASSLPLVFERAGKYDNESGNKTDAFARGTLYFRHGAKSEPANSSDLRGAFERQIRSHRKSWLSGIKKVTQAPRGSEVVLLRASREKHSITPQAQQVRLTNNPQAKRVFISRDRSKSKGAFLHEQVSDALFDEINNVVDANRILARGQKRFALGIEQYFRIYAERGFVAYNQSDFELLLHSGLDSYAPYLYWSLKLPTETIARELSDSFIVPKHPKILHLTRFAILLGPSFCEWLWAKWNAKWKNHLQPPHFYQTFKEMRTKSTSRDATRIASRLKPSWYKAFPGEKPLTVAELKKDPDLIARLISISCSKLVTKHSGELRSLARDLDYLAYGDELNKRGSEIGDAIASCIGDQEVGDVAADSDVEIE